MKFRRLAVLLPGLLLPLVLSAQEVATAAATPAAPPAQSILQTILHGGPLSVLIWTAILVTSITMVTFVVQNFLTLQRDKLAPPALVESLRAHIDAGNYQEAWETANGNQNYLANVIKGGLERLGRGKEAVEDAVAEISLREVQVVRNRNSYLSVIGVISPMIGLLGTVIGMMSAFRTLGASGISDPRGLATSIGEVLLATASGLFIAIPAFIFYYIFRNRSQMVIVHADDQVNSLVRDLPFEELEGLRIGATFSAGAGAPVAGARSSQRMSAALATNCPVCNGAVTPADTECPHCGTALQWAG